MPRWLHYERSMGLDCTHQGQPAMKEASSYSSTLLQCNSSISSQIVTIRLEFETRPYASNLNGTSNVMMRRGPACQRYSKPAYSEQAWRQQDLAARPNIASCHQTCCCSAAQEYTPSLQPFNLPFLPAACQHQIQHLDYDLVSVAIRLKGHIYGAFKALFPS